MQTVQFHLTSNVEAKTVRECTGPLLSETGRMLACVWPELDAWLDDLVPELADGSLAGLAPAWRLTDRERRGLLSPEFDAVYHVTDPVMLARLILAAIRHSELSIVLAPAGVTRGKLAGLLRLADRSAFRAVDRATPLRADWLLDVGSYNGDDKMVRIFSDKADRLAELSDLLVPLRLNPTPRSEGSSA